MKRRTRAWNRPSCSSRVPEGSRILRGSEPERLVTRLVTATGVIVWYY
ncbi:hypothetical protein ACICHK_04385 [Streptomyces sp. AHU1]